MDSGGDPSAPKQSNKDEKKAQPITFLQGNRSSAASKPTRFPCNYGPLLNSLIVLILLVVFVTSISPSTTAIVLGLTQLIGRILIESVTLYCAATGWLILSYPIAVSIIFLALLNWLQSFTHANVIDIADDGIRVGWGVKSFFLLCWDDIGSIFLFCPHHTMLPRKWLVGFGTQGSRPVTIKLPVFGERGMLLLETVRAKAPWMSIDPALIELWEPAIADSHTELWLKSLSNAPRGHELMPLFPGAKLHNGRYLIMSRLGVGGQGTAYLAQDLLHGASSKSVLTVALEGTNVLQTFQPDDHRDDTSGGGTSVGGGTSGGGVESEVLQGNDASREENESLHTAREFSVDNSGKCYMDDPIKSEGAMTSLPTASADWNSDSIAGPMTRQTADSSADVGGRIVEGSTACSSAASTACSDGSTVSACSNDVSTVSACSKHTVVIKETIFPVYVDDRIRQDAERRFKSEVELLNRLRHPQIVASYESFIDGARGYLVMEYIEGMSLRQRVKNNCALSENEVLPLAIQMAEILQYLHSLEPAIIHRDFTPDNLLLGSSNIVKLIDFNVAREVASTRTATVVGKHAYLPPEQFRGDACTQSDIYAFGATLYFLLVGQDPEPITQSFPAENATSVSARMNEIVAKCTDTELSTRYASAAEILDDLRRIQSCLREIAT